MEQIPISQENTPKVDIESHFFDFVPQEFIDDPVEYFEREGRNIKTGEKKIDEQGVVREDPTAVKDLPAWKNHQGEEILTVGRRVNVSKGSVGESGDPFYEYTILEKLAQMGLPALRVPSLRLNKAGFVLLLWNVFQEYVGQSEIA